MTVRIALAIVGAFSTAFIIGAVTKSDGASAGTEAVQPVKASYAAPAVGGLASPGELPPAASEPEPKAKPSTPSTPTPTPTPTPSPSPSPAPAPSPSPSPGPVIEG